MVFWGLVFLSQDVILINILQFLWRQRFQFRGFDGTPPNPPPPFDPPQIREHVPRKGLLKSFASQIFEIYLNKNLYFLAIEGGLWRRDRERARNRKNQVWKGKAIVTGWYRLFLFSFNLIVFLGPCLWAWVLGDTCPYYSLVETGQYTWLALFHGMRESTLANLCFVIVIDRFMYLQIVPWV